MKLTPKQEKFAECVASGMTYADSLRESYNTENYTDESIYVEASRKMADPKIMLRVDEIKKECIKDIKYDIEDCFKELEDLRADAKTDDDRAIQKGCIESKGKLKGLFIDKKEINDTTDYASILKGLED